MLPPVVKDTKGSVRLTLPQVVGPSGGSEVKNCAAVTRNVNIRHESEALKQAAR